MTRSQACAAAVSGAALCGATWTALASAVSLSILGQLEYFRAPWWQWWLIEPYWRLNWLEALAIWGGAIVAVLPFIPVAFAITSVRKRRRQQAIQQRLYGESRWACGAELNDGGFRETRRPG